MATLKWYRWWPGAIPQLERVTPEIRGLAHALMDALWVNPDCIDDPSEMCRVLMLPCSEETAKVLNNLLPALNQFIDSERDDYNGHHDAKVEAGRKGGLARAERAKQTQAVLSSASSSQAHPSILPSILPKDINPPTPRKRGTAKAPTGFVDDDFQLIDDFWSAYPKRKNDQGEPLSKGNKQKALIRLKEAMHRNGLNRDDVLEIAADYHKHPNVLKGFVQAAEVFWGVEGHWFGCWGNVRYFRGQNAKQA